VTQVEIKKQATRKQRQGADSRELILDATERLMGTRGYAATSISDICKACGLPASSIYWHFGSKEGVLAAVMDRGANRFFAAIPKDDEADVEGRLDVTGRLLAQHPDFLRLFYLLSLERSADPAVAAHLGERMLRSGKDREEHAIVVRRLARALREHAVWIAESPEPVVVKVANIQHLATPIRAQLSRPVPAVRLAGMLHPTPAVGGEPWAAASPLIPELEGLDRGWYAGPVGWTDTNEDGEFCVARRSALLCGPVARLYAGVGVVRDSDPASELAETEVKLRALLPVLGADRSRRSSPGAGTTASGPPTTTSPPRSSRRTSRATGPTARCRAATHSST
jgi:AcrR family transcriptional regulator